MNSYASELARVRLRWHEREMLLRLQQANGAWVTVTALLEASHDGHADKLVDPANMAHLLIHRIRKAIKPSGWRIVTSHGYGYKLERSDAAKHPNSS
jgi:DNA-binding response OmpR family regulator